MSNRNVRIGSVWYQYDFYVQVLAIDGEIAVVRYHRKHQRAGMLGAIHTSVLISHYDLIEGMFPFVTSSSPENEIQVSVVFMSGPNLNVTLTKDAYQRMMIDLATQPFTTIKDIHGPTHTLMIERINHITASI